MKLSERLTKVCEEKARLEIENQRLTGECINWQRACEQKQLLFNKMFDMWAKADTEVNELRDKVRELRLYCNTAKSLFERCGAFIANNRKMLSVSDYLVKELKLNQIKRNVIDKAPTNKSTEESEDDNIIDLFNQSAEHLKPFSIINHHSEQNRKEG